VVPRDVIGYHAAAREKAGNASGIERLRIFPAKFNL